ncbi:hypothetical protein [Janibacter terrae]|uniref:hypothetical protein n=1 Tax=Janibacter terrae TaxID=103817 RepID=UPI0031F72B76
MSEDPQEHEDEPRDDEARAEEAQQLGHEQAEEDDPRSRRRPEQTRDDTDRGWGERPDESEHDRWLREQRPPHWE